MQQKSNNKRNGGKRSRKSRPGQMVHLPRAVPNPVSAHCVLGYSNKVNLIEPAAGTGSSHFFRLNSVYDPDASGVGSSALLYNFYAARFLNYRVNKATVRVQAAILSGLSGGFGEITLGAVPDQATIPSDPTTWKMIPGTVMKPISNTAAGPAVAELVGTWDLAKLVRFTKAQYNTEADFSAPTGSNPARQVFAFVGGESIGSSSATTFTISYQITYVVEWFSPLPVQ